MNKKKRRSQTAFLGDTTCESPQFKHELSFVDQSFDPVRKNKYPRTDATNTRGARSSKLPATVSWSAPSDSVRSVTAVTIVGITLTAMTAPIAVEIHFIGFLSFPYSFRFLLRLNDEKAERTFLILQA
jgi:hypothetical protein